MNWARIAKVTMECIVVAAVVVVGTLAGGAVLGIALGAGASVAVFSPGSNQSPPSARLKERS